MEGLGPIPNRVEKSPTQSVAQPARTDHDVVDLRNESTPRLAQSGVVTVNDRIEGVTNKASTSSATQYGIRYQLSRRLEWVGTQLFGNYKINRYISLYSRMSSCEIKMNPVSSRREAADILRSFAIHRPKFDAILARGFPITGHTPSLPALHFLSRALATMYGENSAFVRALDDWFRQLRKSVPGNSASGAKLEFKDDKLSLSIDPMRPGLHHRGLYLLSQLMKRHPEPGQWYSFKLTETTTTPHSINSHGIFRFVYLVGAMSVTNIFAIYNIAEVVANRLLKTTLPELSNWLIVGGVAIGAVMIAGYVAVVKSFHDRKER